MNIIFAALLVLGAFWGSNSLAQNQEQSATQAEPVTQEQAAAPALSVTQTLPVAQDPSVYESRSDIGQLINKWGYFRDHDLWDELRATFHPGGEIQVTWYIGSFDGFVDASIGMAEGGAKSAHIMKPSIIDVVGDRAFAITPASITGRGDAGVEVDLNSYAMFFDFLERKGGEWRFTRRVAVYQKDRMDSVGPSFRFWLMSFFLDTDKFDPAYKHLGAAMEAQGYEILPGQIVDHSDESRALYREGQDWLKG